jgi:predicted membrane protein
MKFERRDIILIVGLLLFMIGLTPFTGLAIAVVIVTIMYFAIKVYVEKRKQSIEQDVGEGICMECGSKIFNKKCPSCDYSKE